MANVDDRVVAMSFENSKFEAGVAKSISTLEKLRKSLQFSGGKNGLDQLEASASKFSLAGIGNAVEGLKNKFSTLSIIGITALTNIANRAVNTGLSLVKSLTVSPIADGLKEYETNLNSVQTILANTQASGATLGDVNAALQELNTYSDKTIYNFSEMARNIGTFTAAGVDLKTSTEAIKGIANLAALSGSNSEQASSAMYQLSQAISAGRVGLQDWNSVVNAGMGGTVFQRALAQTAERMGTLSSGAVQLTGKMKNATINGQSFRESITAKPGEKSWLSSAVLTETLKQFTGDLTDAQLRAKGYTEEQIKSIQQTAKTAQDAATQVKTLSQVFDVAKETVGSGWATTFQTIFGDFGEAKSTFTGLSNAINGFITASSKSRNDVLKDWKELGGRTALIEGIKNVFEALGSVLKPIKEAFRDIFPATTGRQLADLTKRFRDFTESLKIGPETAQNLKRTFAGFFAVLDIGKQIVKGIFGVLGDLFGAATSGSGGFLKFTGNIGDWLVALDEAIKKGGGLARFFDTLGKIISVPVAGLAVLKDAILGLFDGFNQSDAAGISSSLTSMGTHFGPLGGLIAGVTKVWQGFLGVLGDVKTQLQPVIDGISQLFANLGNTLGDAIKSNDFDAVFNVIQTGLLGGIFLIVKRFFSKDLSVDIGGGILGNIRESFDALTGSMKAMQANIQASTLLKIAAAIGLLTASVVALSLIDSEALTRALKAMAVGFGELLGAMAILTKISGAAGFVQIPIIATSLVILATAIDVLTIAVYALSKLSWDELAKGLSGVAGLLTAISLAAIPLSANSAGLTRAGVGIAAIAVAMKILASAVKDFGSMDWSTIGKGLSAVAGSLVAIGLAANLFPPGLVVTGLGLIAVATALNILARAVNSFGNMDLLTIGKGIGAIAAAMVAIGLAMSSMPPNMAVQAAGLLLVSIALKGIASAISKLGSLSLTQLAKGIGAIAASLAILAVGLSFMTSSLAGSAALLVAAGALTLLAPALKSMGRQSWTQIAKGLISLAGALALFGIAGIALAPVAPVLLALGVAMLALGAGMTLVGGGVALLSTGISALVVAGPAGIKLLISSLTSLAEAIPKAITSFVVGLAKMIGAIGENAPKFVEGIVKILDSLLNAVIQSMPKIALAFGAIIQAALKVIRDNFPTILSTGFAMLKSLLSGIRNNIGQVTVEVGRIITTFLGALASQLPKIIKSGANTLVKFLEGLATNLPKILASAASVVVKFLTGIASHIGEVIDSGAKLLVKFLEGLARNITKVIEKGGDVVAKFLLGIARAIPSIAAAAGKVVAALIRALVRESLKLVDEGARAIINFINGMATAVRKYEPQLIAAGANLASALIEGLVGGIGAGLSQVLGSIGKLAGSAIKKAKSLFGIHSPSTVFAEIGGFVVQGFANGLTNSSPALNAVDNLGNSIIDGFKQLFQISSPSKVMSQIGKFVGEGFAEGLKGSSTDISSAFSELNDKLTEAIATARETIATEQAKLNELLDAKKPDYEAIKKARAAIDENEKLLRRSADARKVLTKDLKDERDALKRLSIDYDTITDKLKEAQQALQSAVDTRDSAIKSFSDQYSTLPDLDSESDNQLATYTTSLQNQVNAVAAYQSTLDQLRALGLDDATYQKLLKDGTADQEFATQLLAGGTTAVAGLNALDAQLQTQSELLANHAGVGLYQAGVIAAQGLVDGLASKQADIVKKMVAIAAAMVAAIRKALKIKSPSREFEEVGAYALVGLAQGLADTSKAVTKAAEKVGNDAVEGMRAAMSRISDVLATDINSSPVISPVLDLTNVQAGAKQLSGLMNVTPITAAASYGQAASISASRQQELDSKPAVEPVMPAEIKFEQHNTSPESLSTADIYRNTQNQLALAKSVLGLAS